MFDTNTSWRVMALAGICTFGVTDFVVWQVYKHNIFPALQNNFSFADITTIIFLMTLLLVLFHYREIREIRQSKKKKVRV